MNIYSRDIDTLRCLWTADLDPLFWRDGRDSLLSEWYGHVPFAHWIVSVAKPRSIVELGTHNGASYSAFCEAVLRIGLETRCYAVDTWKGDHQAGDYGEEVYLDFKRFHDKRYGAFSELLRCTFDEALTRMPDASVDLLHIDGLHTYEAVRHDFDSWRAKLSDRGVVLFHDTNVRERDFGVWRLWEELHAQFPCFEFVHCHGLGVLVAGHSTSPEVKALCSLSDPLRINAIRQRFCLLGERWILLGRRERLQREEVAPRDERIRRLENEIAARDARISSLEVESTRSKAEEANRSVVERELREQLHSQSLESAERIRQLEEHLRCGASQSAERVRLLEEEVTHLKSSLHEARQLGQRMKTSLSWRLTWPLRVVRDLVRPANEKVERPDNLALESLNGSNTGVRSDPGVLPDSLAGSLNAPAKTDPVAKLLLTIFDESHYLKQVPSAAGSGIAPLEHYRRIGWRESHNPHPLFDVDWYLKTNRDVAEAGVEPLGHYLEYGWREGRSPHSLFDLGWYLRKNRNVAEAGVEPLSQYLEYGWKDGRSPHALFDVGWYLRTNRDIAEAGVEPLGQYLEFGWKKHRRPHPLFDIGWYLKKNRDVAEAGIEPLGHYLEYGWRKGCGPHSLFNLCWYLGKNCDVAEAGVEPLSQYLEYGWKDGRSPHALFDVGWYLRTNRDIAEAGVEPLGQYLEFGWKEHRRPHPLFDIGWYLTKNRDVAESKIEPLAQYLEYGWKEGRSPHLLFDVSWYLRQNRDVAERSVEPLGQYLESGWKQGRSPHPFFDVGWYLRENPDVAEIGVEPLGQYLEYGWKEGRSPHPLFELRRYLSEGVLEAALGPLYLDCEPRFKRGCMYQSDAIVDRERQLKGYLEVAEAVFDPRVAHVADLVRSSPLFDADAYDSTANARVQGLDPALHYVLVGEKRGIKPSTGFDPVYYGERYPDVAAWGGNRLSHYLQAGRAEGRRALPIADTYPLPATGINPDRGTVLLIVHAASWTRTPILGWNIARKLGDQFNVVAILMRGGNLEGAFADVAVCVVCRDDNEILDVAEGSRLACRLKETYEPSYVIANGVETRHLSVALADLGVPVVALVHEFSCCAKPEGSLQSLYKRAAEIVFSANIVRRSWEADYPILRLRVTHVLPPGQSENPRSRLPANGYEREEAERAFWNRLRPDGAENDVIVVGLGFLDCRTGVNLLIRAATAVLASSPDAPVRFVWIGENFGTETAMEVLSYLSEQITRHGLDDRFLLMDALQDLESVCKEANVLFLNARLDPLPNVSIDATLRGIPVVCFAEANGMAEILASSDKTRELVVPHLDAGVAGALIGSLASDRDRLNRLGESVRELARAHFDMSAYVGALAELGCRARQTARQQREDAALILTQGAFDPPLYLGDRARFVDLAAAVREYSMLASRYNYARAPVVDQACTRRPLAGFHPVIYAWQSPAYDMREGRDPLAHYLRAGRPKGPWVHPVLRIEAPESSVRPLAKSQSRPLRVVLHGHFYYTDHLSDFTRALAANEQRCHLILSTDSAEKAAEIRASLSERGFEADIRVVPNRGRDIAPFLTVLEEAIGRCDLLGHVHGKRSPHVNRHVGDRWRMFLWQHLIGDEMPMVDIIKQAFIDDPALGLVFPEDPYLVGWDKNLEIAQELSARIGLRAPLPASFECPAGTMFWARPEALAPLLHLGFSCDDYPPEPLAIDGTKLHALERLLPLVAWHAGYHYTTTYLPRVVR